MISEASWPYVVGLVSILIYIFFLTFISLVRGWKERKFEFGFGDAVVSLIPAMLWFISSGTVEKLVLSATGVEYQRADKAIQRTLDLSIEKLVDAVSPVYVGDFLDKLNFKSESDIYFEAENARKSEDLDVLANSDQIELSEILTERFSSGKNKENILIPEYIIVKSGDEYKLNEFENLFRFVNNNADVDKDNFIIFLSQSGKYIGECTYDFILSNKDGNFNQDYQKDTDDLKLLIRKVKNEDELPSYLAFLKQTLNTNEDVNGECYDTADSLNYNSSMLESLKKFEEGDTDSITVLNKEGGYFGNLNFEDVNKKILIEITQIFQNK